MTGSVALSGLLLLAAVLVTVSRRQVRLGAGRRTRRASSRVWAGSVPAGWLRLAPAAWAVAVVVVLAGPPVAALAALGGGAAAVVVRLRRTRAAAVRADALAAVVADGVLGLVADLSAGQPPLDALASLARDQEAGPSTGARQELADLLRVVVATGRLGGDVTSGLRAAAQAPGAGGLGSLAAAWQVADETGAPLSGVLDRVAAGLARQRAAARRLEVSLSGARTSARLLVALPAFGLLIGAGLGVSPLTFLVGPWEGRVCLVAGMGLSAAGWWWTDRLAARARASSVS